MCVAQNLHEEVGFDVAVFHGETGVVLDSQHAVGFADVARAQVDFRFEIADVSDLDEAAEGSVVARQDASVTDGESREDVVVVAKEVGQPFALRKKMSNWYIETVSFAACQMGS